MGVGLRLRRFTICFIIHNHTRNHPGGNTAVSSKLLFYNLAIDTPNQRWYRRTSDCCQCHTLRPTPAHHPALHVTLRYHFDCVLLVRSVLHRLIRYADYDFLEI